MAPGAPAGAPNSATEPFVAPSSQQGQSQSSAAAASSAAAVSEPSEPARTPDPSVANQSENQITGKRKTPESSVNPPAGSSTHPAPAAPAVDSESGAANPRMAGFRSDGVGGMNSVYGASTAPRPQPQFEPEQQPDLPTHVLSQQQQLQLHLQQQQQQQQQHQQHQQQARQRSRYPQYKQQQHQQDQSIQDDHSQSLSIGFPVWQTLQTHATPGCPHYTRNCHLRAPCCNALVACRRCHDALVPDGHALDRRAVKMVRCLACGSQDQALASNCAFCSIRFAAYFCAKCAMYDDTPGRSIFHCDGCGVCRVGRREDFIHCDTCRACLPAHLFDRHKCVRSVLNRPCSMCKINMQESVRRCIIMTCGHAMHQGCFEHHIKTSFACSTCGKSVVNMQPYWQRMDQLLENEMAITTDFVSIKCRDCGQPGKAKLHKHFYKCPNPSCGSYNTFVEETLST